MLFSGVIIVLIGHMKGEWQERNVSVVGIQAFFYLVIAGSIVGYSCFCYALLKIPAMLVSDYTYINPIVALWQGWLILNEHITGMMIVAMLITVDRFILLRGEPIKIKLFLDKVGCITFCQAHINQLYYFYSLTFN